MGNGPASLRWPCDEARASPGATPDAVTAELSRVSRYRGGGGRRETFPCEPMATRDDMNGKGALRFFGRQGLGNDSRCDISDYKTLHELTWPCDEPRAGNDRRSTDRSMCEQGAAFCWESDVTDEAVAGRGRLVSDVVRKPSS
jgi:hypothetical protein